MDNYLDFRKELDFNKLNGPAEILKQGGIVIFPTETVYGIGANALNEDAVKKIYEAKKRPPHKPISLLVSNMDMVEMVAKDITPLEYKLMETFFPGPFTIILKKKDIVPDIVTCGQNTVGVRMPDLNLTRKLIDFAGVPLATPSANISGEPSGTNLESIIDKFKDSVDYYIDGGESKLGIASTIVKVIDGVPHILREGSITKEEIEKIKSQI